MSTVLLVPMRLDALVLDAERTVAEAMTDFSRLPFTDGTRDVHASTANIGQWIVSQPFRDLNLSLAAGVHLHWLLPRGLCQAAQAESGAAQGARFPRVPNRWLVTRRLGSRIDRWIVESDYLAPDGEGDGISYPVVPDPGSGNHRPFRRLGRALPYDAWSPNETGIERIDHLSAVGYGDPAFAAFYPNCRSVFGFCDRDAALAGSIPAGLQYEVLGWYSDPETDELHRLLAGLPTHSQKECRAAVQAAFGWTYVLPNDGSNPDLVACFGRVTFPSGGTPPEDSAISAAVGLAIGHTGIEALAAYTAADIDPDNQATIEDQLVAMSMDAELGQHLIDFGPRFAAARHRSGFTAIDGGKRFTVQEAVMPKESADPSAKGVPLPAPIRMSLDATNRLQEEYDKAQAQLDASRRQTFADWIKYMLAAHPPPYQSEGLVSSDAVRLFMQGRSLPEIELRQQEAGGEVSLDTNEHGDVLAANAPGSEATSLAGRLAGAITGLLQELRALNARAADGAPQWVLRVGAAPRFWQPAEPVVLLTGDAVAESARRIETGLLTCPVLTDAPSDTLVPDDLTAIESAIDAASADGGIGFNTWTAQPWHPFAVQWSAEVFPIRAGGNLYTRECAYQPDFIEKTYVLPEQAEDLETRPDEGTVYRGTSIYTGTSILSPYASRMLTPSVEAYLLEQDEVLQQFHADHPEIDPTAPIADSLPTLRAWYEQKVLLGTTAAERAMDPVFTALRALAILNQLPALSQSLAGFNAALLMTEQALQLPISDPLAFTTALPFIDKVRDAVGNTNGLAPLPGVDFNPIRTGALRLLGLRLLDTFGRYRSVPATGVIPSAPFSLVPGPGSAKDLLRLLPRVSQPARLRFRFRAASGGMEAHELPATSPICGWLLPSRADRSISVYSAAGEALGIVVAGGGIPWEPAPGGHGVAAEAIEDPTLRRVVQNLLGGDAFYRGAFQLALESALHHIAPNGLARAQGLAMLMSRPLAVTRAVVSLDLQGLPAIHQGWIALSQDLRRDARRDDGFPAVRFPVRIGEARLLDDGLVGYWIEREDGGLGEIFHAPKSRDCGDPRIRTPGGEPDNLALSLDGRAVALTLLCDPTGLVHAISGITPVEGIGIPGDQFHSALAAMEVSFLTAPLLSLAAQIQIPLREEPGYAWSFLQQRRDGWDEVGSIGVVRRLAFLNVFGEALGTEIWEELLCKKWIVEREDPEVESATVTPKDQITTALDPRFTTALFTIEALLLRSCIGPAELLATFTGPSALREGWLTLWRAPEETTPDKRTRDA